MEIWKNIDGFQDYKVSNFGNVKSFKNKKQKILKSRVGKNGYEYVILMCKNKPKTKTIHRLVAVAFLKNNNFKKCVNHKDSCRTNNNVKNLEWSTHSENINHAIIFGYFKKGVNHFNSKLTLENVNEIRNIFSIGKTTQKSLSEKYKVNQSTISDIINFKIFKNEQQISK